MPRQPDADPVAITAALERIFPGERCRFQRTETGVSTPVYRVWRGDTVFYLRLAEAPEDSLAPDVYVHRLLRERGIRVPEVVYFERFDDRLRRSLMLTTAIAGEPLAAGTAGADTEAILREAGRDLAILNSVPVAGFGWVRRDRTGVQRLEADHATYNEFLFEYLATDLKLLGAGMLSGEEVTAIRPILDSLTPVLQMEQARLAHGDLDVTHIFQQNGRYTGIIDFGEIRGADPLYDLGHFHLHDGETLPRVLLPELLAGYQEVAPLTHDCEQRLDLLALLIGIRALAHGLGRPHTVFLARRLRALLAGLARRA